MSSPNEPGYARTGEGPGSANGSPAGSGHSADSGDAAPWQRGPAARPANAPRRQPEAPARGDARVNRFVSGAAPTQDHEARSEAYASELPDLSGPQPRPPQRKPSPERPEPAARPATNRLQIGTTRHHGPVRASMQIRRVDPWSTLKVSLVLSVVLFFVWMIAVAFLYLVLGGMGVWSKLNSNVGDLLTSASGTTGGELVSSGTIFGSAALIGLVNIVLLTAMATIGAFVYNLTTDLVGGVEVTLADRD